MPGRLGFSIAGCTGEDPEFPATELLYHSTDSRGWCTPRFSVYPQVLTLRLEGPARLAQIQLLSHESKIAEKVELQVGIFASANGGGTGGLATLAPAPTNADPDKATWRKLGHLNFDSNEQSNFTARELKSVAMPPNTVAHLVRLVFHGCHPNATNMYGQISIVALSLMGDLLVPVPLAPITNMPPQQPYGMGAPPGQPVPAYMHPFGPPVYQQPPVQQQQQQAPSPAEAAAALAAELGVDTVTAQRIHDLQQQKQQAVEREDYDEAKRLKGAVDRLRAAGGAIAGLEARKLTAVQEEDYDLAKQLKHEIDRMRSSAYAAALSGAAAFSPPHSHRASAVGTSPPAAAPRPSGDGKRFGEAAAAGREAGAAADGAAADYASPPAAARSPPPASPSGDWGNHDDRPAVAKGLYDFQNADESSTPVNIRRRSMPSPAPRAASSAASDAGPPPPGFPSDLPLPEGLSAADAKDAGPLSDLLGEYLARCLFSRTWQLREAALQRLAADLEAGRLESLESGGAEAVKTVARTLQRACRDKVAAVFSASVAALRALAAAAAAGRVTARDLQAALGELLPLLVEKAADLNQRTREQATEALVGLAGAPEAGLRGGTAPFLRALKPGAAPKVVLGRLHLLSALLPVVGMAGPRGGEGFQLDPFMDFINPALSNSSAEVRSAAIALVLQAAGAAGPSVTRLLPAGLNAKVREQIDAGLLNPTAALAGPVAAVPKASPAVVPAAARAKPAGGSQRSQQGAAPPPPHAPAGAAVAPASQQPQQQQQQAVPLPVAGSPEDDPAVYEAEVREREARLGAAHPDVAEAICNLAILHNQRGDIAAALPLYERALAIWEAACGPESPDVAHTLTDIAVIHLEQGRDDIGRPLLQRALRIQEAQLGPDHPDVLAIRDVLEEEG